MELDLCCSTGCWREGQSVELDLCCSTGCWREGQSVELDLCCSTGCSVKGRIHTHLCMHEYLMHEYLMHLLMEVRKNNIQFLHKTVRGCVCVMYVYPYMVACVCLM